MKKLIAATGLALSLSLASFAAPTSPSGVDEKVLNNFASKFVSAENVQWLETAEYTEAKFNWQNQVMQVFYDPNGDLIAVSRKINYETLPANSMSTIQEKYPGYNPTETIEMNSTEYGLSYYVSLGNAGKKIILKVTPRGEVSVFKKEN